MSRAAVPIKGGDGGAFVPRRRPAHWDDNAKVCLTGEAIAGPARAAFEAGLVTTRDPSDRAHRWREPVAGVPAELDAAWVLADRPTLEARFRGRDLPGCLRRYHRSQMTSRGVAYDSMFDAAAATAHELQAAGIELGWRTRYPRPQARRAAPLANPELYRVNIERANQMAAAGLDRDRVRKKTRVMVTHEEMALLEAGTEILRRGAAGKGRGQGSAIRD